LEFANRFNTRPLPEADMMTITTREQPYSCVYLFLRLYGDNSNASLSSPSKLGPRRAQLWRVGGKLPGAPVLARAAKLTMFFTTILLIVSAAACSRANSEAAKTEVITSQDPNIVQMETPENFAVTAVNTRQVFAELHVNGVITPDVSRTVQVLSLSGGRAIDIRTRVGDDVRKGQVLVRISSPDVSAAFSDLQKFQADELLAQKQLQRAQRLYDRGAIAQKDLEVAQDAEDKARVDLATAQQRVRILGADPRNPSPILDVRAPISGTIVEQNVTGGTGVRSIDNSPNLFTIADLSRVWVLCDVYEDALARVHLGDFADIHINALPDLAFKGKVSNIGRVLDPATRAAKVRIEIDNRGRVLRSGMFVTATFKSTKPQERIVVPTSAVIRMHDKDWVFVPLGGKQFRRQEVQLGPVLPDGVQEVAAGLNSESRVVVSALQFSSASESQ
jgi:cobalt-zinc-cadmium efflux system membrane fusion protein